MTNVNDAIDALMAKLPHPMTLPDLLILLQSLGPDHTIQTGNHLVAWAIDDPFSSIVFTWLDDTEPGDPFRSVMIDEDSLIAISDDRHHLTLQNPGSDPHHLTCHQRIPWPDPGEPSESGEEISSEASLLARQALMDFATQFAAAELAGVVNPIPLNNLIGRFSRGANEAIRTALAAKGL